jgi:hypothetical protein
MFGSLLFEIAPLESLGLLQEGSGWVGALTNYSNITPGSAESLLSASRVRRTYEISLVSLHILQQTAFTKSQV